MKHIIICVLLLFAIFMMLNIPTHSTAQTYDTENLEQVFHQYSDPLTTEMYYNVKAIKTFRWTNLPPTGNTLEECYIDLNRPKVTVENLVRALALAKRQVHQTIYNDLTRAYIHSEKWNSALLFLEKTILIWDSTFADRKREAISELMIRYETKAKEYEIKSLESEKRRTQMLLNLTVGLLIICLFVAILVVQNYKKKKIHAQLETKLEQQRVRQLLQELETRGMDDLVGIREAERKKIAEELHDHVGGSLSTLKLYFDTLSPELKRAEFADLHSNAGYILDETYENIRNMARKYHSVVSINKGMLPAVRSLAQSISATGKIAIHVMETGLSNRLENSVEIALFKSIKELVSNAVKHADPTEVIIEFVRHDDVLIIMVQDDGRGFDPDLESNGMGLMGIRHRIDQLGGEMTIDSSCGYGTTVIINIPLI